MKRKKRGSTSKAKSGTKKPAARATQKKQSLPRGGRARAAKAKSGTTRKKASAPGRQQAASTTASTARKYSQPGAPWWKAYL